MSIVGIEPGELLLAPHHQLSLTVDVDEDGRAGRQRKRIALPGQRSGVALERDDSVPASAERKACHFFF